MFVKKIKTRGDKQQQGVVQAVVVVFVDSTCHTQQQKTGINTDEIF